MSGDRPASSRRDDEISNPRFLPALAVVVNFDDFFIDQRRSERIVSALCL